MARRCRSLHHNLGDKNVVFHSEHRTKKNRNKMSKNGRARRNDFKQKKLAILIKELDNENFNNRR